MFNTCSRPLAEAEPIPQETMEARNKLESETPLEEMKMILGWLINFRRLLIFLPDNKFTAWTKAIEVILNERKSNRKNTQKQILVNSSISARQFLPFTIS